MRKFWTNPGNGWGNFAKILNFRFYKFWPNLPRCEELSETKSTTIWRSPWEGFPSIPYRRQKGKRRWPFAGLCKIREDSATMVGSENILDTVGNSLQWTRTIFPANNHNIHITDSKFLLSIKTKVAVLQQFSGNRVAVHCNFLLQIFPVKNATKTTS